MLRPNLRGRSRRPNWGRLIEIMHEEEEAEAPGRRKGVQSVEIGLAVLEAIAQSPGPVSLSALGQRVGLSPSQTHRYLQSLTATGMAVQDGRSGHYDLGPSARRIGIAALGRFDAFATADRVLPELVADIRWTVLLAVLGAAGPTLVRWYMGRPPVITNLGIGSVLPLHHSATGRAFIAFSDDADIAALLQAEETELRGVPGVDTAEIRREGRANFCLHMEGRFIPGLRAISAPIFDMQGRLAFCATAIANAAFHASDDERICGLLKNACRRITEESGGRWPD